MMSTPTTDRLARAVEGTLTAFSKVRHAAQGVVRLYNTVAEHAPIPLPRLPDGSRRVWPRERYSPPPPRPTTNLEPTPTAAGDARRPGTLPLSEPNPGGAGPAFESTDTAAAQRGLVVERSGPSLEEYRKRRAADAAATEPAATGEASRAD
jgi:hypothetical protein